jgi:hypothetical protein
VAVSILYQELVRTEQPWVTYIEHNIWEGKIELTHEIKSLLIETGKEWKGSARRLFMARTVKAMGKGGQRRAERELGWDRETIRKGVRELESGII